MKPISILILICLCGCIELSAQTSSLADAFVAGQKKTITGLLITEGQLKGKQAALLNILKTFEDQYDDKRGVAANFTSNLWIASTIGLLILDIDEKILAIERDIRFRKFATFGILHGLARIESNLQREKGYYEKLQDELRLVGGWSLLGVGGTGHVYTAFLKLLDRFLELEGKISEIEKNMGGLSAASWLLKPITIN